MNELILHLEAEDRSEQGLVGGGIVGREPAVHTEVFEDAQQASVALGITLPARGNHGGAPIPMCGVPVHAAEAYLAKLIRAGF
ncbi:MAG: hypothetical protein CFE26_12630, partial [Verrucomicrobiales bacterium VVV1]